MNIIKRKNLNQFINNKKISNKLFRYKQKRRNIQINKFKINNFNSKLTKIK